jgi:hypothetical protein
MVTGLSASKKRLLRQRPARPEPAQQGKQDDSADRGDHDRRQVEAFLVAQPEQAGKQEAAHERADDADDEIGEKAVVATGDPFGKPAGDQTLYPKSRIKHHALGFAASPVG